MLGFRSQQYKQVIFNQAFGQAGSAERRIFIPAPLGGENTSVPVHQLQPLYAEESNFIPTNRGLIAARDHKFRATYDGGASQWNALIPFNGSTSADSVLLGHVGTEIYNLTQYIDVVSASVSAGNEVSVSATTFPGGADRYGYTEFNDSLILVHDSASAVRYTTALGKFIPYSATASGDSIHNMWGINSFKRRIYAWPRTQPKFFYGSTDSTLGTLEPFNLGAVAPGSQHITSFFGMTRDGGSGPDDFATFIMNDGKVVVYQGSDPGDANNWALVGTYQIGKPLGRRCAVAAGAEHYVMCEDDLYVLPRDLQGKRQQSNYISRTRTAPNNFEIDGTYNNVTGNMFWEDENQALGVSVHLAGQPAFTVLADMDAVTTFLGRTFFSVQNGNDEPVLTEFNADAAGNINQSALKTAPIPTNSRTNISLYNPLFDHTEGKKIKFKARILYDYSASADWVTASASGDTTGIWLAGFGTGRAPQIEVVAISASVDANTSASLSELVFRGVDLTITENNGI